MPQKSKRQRGIEAIQRLLDAGYTPDDFRAAIDKLAKMEGVKIVREGKDRKVRKPGVGIDLPREIQEK